MSEAMETRGIRLDPDLVDEIEKLVPQLNEVREIRRVHGRVTFSTVVRMAIDAGLRAVRTDYGVVDPAYLAGSEGLEG